ncbi:MAG: hypothetical protein RLY87_1236 [Chloroflexota bacterium]
MNQIRKTFTSPVNIVLMALAIGINIAVGQLVAILKLPIYLDSIGTVLVGALLGPVAGFVTGILGTVIWALTLNPGALPYAIVAGIIGLMAGIFGRRGLFTSNSPAWIGAVVGAVFFVAVSVFVLTLYTFTGDIWAIQDKDGAPISIGSLFAANQILFAAVALVGAVLGFLLIKNGGYIGLAGILTGIVAAAVSAPISAYTSGGLNGSGTDVLVASFLAAGQSVLTSTLGQGMVSDPFDKLASYMMVWAIINLLPVRVRDRFEAE